MKIFILLSFFFLGFAFFVMSGGASFDPDATREARIAARLAEAPLPPEPQTDMPVVAEEAPVDTVTRVSLSLTTIDDVLKEEDAPREPILPADEIVARQPDVPVVRLTRDNEIILPSIIFPGSTTAAASTAAIGSTDIRSVARTNVNLRGGPGTDFEVVSQLTEGDRVEVLDDPGNGWVQLRPVNGGPVGWMADFLLTRG
jgi:hypothetical protein